MPKAPIDQARWQAWIDHVCRGVGVDPAQVDVAAIHGFSGEVASCYTRPMAPVASHLWGLARGVRPESADAARDHLLAAAREAGR